VNTVEISKKASEFLMIFIFLAKAVNDDEPNCFKIVMRMRMQTAARCTLNAAGTIISARYDDSQYSR